MDVLTPEIILTPTEWCEEASTFLETIYEPCHAHMVRDMEKDVQRGFSRLYAAVLGGQVLGYAVLRFEKKPSGDLELVIVAAKMGLLGANLTNLLLPNVEKFAKEKGAKFMRFHTARKGLGRKMKPHGYKELEAVFMKEL